jgi:hypothetical protein
VTALQKQNHSQLTLAGVIAALLVGFAGLPGPVAGMLGYGGGVAALANGCSLLALLEGAVVSVVYMAWVLTPSIGGCCLQHLHETACQSVSFIQP